MNKFDKVYYEEFGYISEGMFKNLATAGLVGAGAFGAYNHAHAHNTKPPVVQTLNDNQIIDKTLPITAWAEGFRESMYPDSKGIPTVGHGFNLTAPNIIKELEKFGYNAGNLRSRNEVMDENDSKVILKRLMEQSLNDARQFVDNFDQLDPIAQIVLVDMSYNLGLTRLSGFKRFKSALEREDYESAKNEMIDSKWYRDVGRRSKRLVQLMDAVADRT